MASGPSATTDGRIGESSSDTGPLLAVQVQPEVGAAAEHLDHVAEDRQPVVTHDRFEIAARGRLGPCMLGPVVGQQPLLEQRPCRAR